MKTIHDVMLDRDMSEYPDEIMDKIDAALDALFGSIPEEHREGAFVHAATYAEAAFVTWTVA